MAQYLAGEFIELGRLLAKFQSRELCLKIFITKDNFRNSAFSGQYDKTHSTLDLENMTLGDSLKKVKKLKLIKNELLIKRLTALKKHRNFIAHKGFLLVSDMPSKKFFLGNETNPLDYPKLNAELDEVVELLIVEYKEFELVI